MYVAASADKERHDISLVSCIGRVISLNVASDALET